MRLKALLPKFWLLNYPYDKDCDNFFKELIVNRRELKFLYSNEYELCFKYKTCFYNVWITTKYFAYLNRVTVIKGSQLYNRSRVNFFSDISEGIYLARKSTLFNNVRPSRETMINFYELIELPVFKRLQLYKLTERSFEKRDIDYVMLSGNKGQIIKSATSLTFLPK